MCSASPSSYLMSQRFPWLSSSCGGKCLDTCGNNTVYSNLNIDCMQREGCNIHVMNSKKTTNQPKGLEVLQLMLSLMTAASRRCIEHAEYNSLSQPTGSTMRPKRTSIPAPVHPHGRYNYGLNDGPTVPSNSSSWRGKSFLTLTPTRLFGCSSPSPTSRPAWARSLEVTRFSLAAANL